MKTTTNAIFILNTAASFRDARKRTTACSFTFCPSNENAIVSYSTDYQSNANSPSEHLQTINLECDKLTFTLNQLLTYERTSNLVADLKIEALSLKDLIKEVVNDLKDYFITKEVFPKVTLVENTIIYSDRKWLKIVLYQIINNAIKYGETESSIQIIYDEATLRIQNYGDSIPESEISRVFELFYTGVKGRTSGEATGIGLYLVKRF